MSHTRLVEALALLLSDASLRQQFALDAPALAGQLNLDDEAREIFLALPVQQLETQAELLIKKRMREAWKFIPLSFQGLNEKATDIFTRYANHYWPDSHRRHEQDAYQFCRFLKNNHFPYNQSEWNRMRFLYTGKKCSLGFARDALIRGRKTLTLQVYFRYKQMPKEWRFYFGA